jgi:tetratricopeptide (TPR) repeat protein
MKSAVAGLSQAGARLSAWRQSPRVAAVGVASRPRTATTAQAAALLALAIATVYATGLSMGFHFDDSHVIENNPAIHSLTNVPGFFYDLTTSSASPDNRVLRPLLLISFALNYAISGTAPWSYHLFNIVLHWIVALLVFRLVRDHLWLGPEAWPVALAAALVVAVHPLNSSAVNYVSARSAILTAVFYLGAFDAALRRRREWCLGLFVLALLTKETAVTLPLALLAYRLVDRARGADDTPSPGLGLISALGGLAVASLLYRSYFMPPVLLAAVHGGQATPWQYFMTEWSAYLYYLRLFAWPNALVIDRVDYPIAHSITSPQAWLSLVTLFGLGLVAWRARRRAPALTFAALWFLVALAAESTFFPLAEPVNEHRPYLAMLGLGTLAAVGLRGIANLVARRTLLPAAAVFAVVLTFVATGFGAATVRRNETWRNDVSLWRDATEKSPGNLRAWMNAGHAALALQHYDEARALLLEGYRLGPCYSYTLLNLSALERAVGNHAAALRWADEGVRCNPQHALSHYYRAAALEWIGRPAEALDEYRATGELDPTHVEAAFSQGRLLERQGAWAAAADAYDRALARDPSRTDAAIAAGVIYNYRLSDPVRALEHYDAVLRSVPSHYGAHYQRAVALLAAGREAEAVAAWRAFVPLARAINDQATLEAAPAKLREASDS